MAWGWDNYDNMMGGGLLGELTEEEKRRLRMQAMGAMGAGLLDAGGWSQTPQTLGQGMARGFAYGQQTYEQGAKSLTDYKDRKVTRDATLAKQQQETETRTQLMQMIDSGNFDPQKAMKLVALNPSLSNVVQQYLKSQEKEKPDPFAEAPRTQTIGGVTYYNGGGGWKPLPKDKPAGGDSGPKPTTKQQDFQFLVANGMDPNLALATVFGTGKGKDEKEGDAPGGNPRQIAGREVRNSAALDYAANLTGLPKDQLKDMDPAQVAEEIRKRGERNMQGGVARFIGGIPFVGEGIVNSVNSDLAPYASQMAAGQVSINNPAGDTGEKAFDLAARQVPTPQMDLETQAQLIEKMLSEAQGNKPKPDKPARRKRFNPATGTLEDVQ